MSARHNSGPILDCGDQFGDPAVPILDPALARQRLKCYLIQMAALHPDREHPNMEFVDALVEDRACVKDQDTAMYDLQSNSGQETAMDEVKDSIKNLTLSIQSQFKEINTKLSVQDTRNVLSEVSSRQQILTQREKDRKFRGNSFVQPMAKFHALDLFDIQQDVVDLAGHASLVCPQLASTFGTSASESVGQVEYDASQTVSLGQIAPLFEMIGRLHWNVDNKVHIQQMAGTSKAGYVNTYQYIQRKKDGNASFSGSRTDREYWASERLDIEKEILKEKAHEKQLAGISSAASKKSTSRSSNSGPSTSESSGQPKTGKQKHNSRQRKL